MEALQSKIKDLEAERQALKQKMEECSIASILLGLSSKGISDSTAQQLMEPNETTNKANEHAVALLTGGGRRRFASDTAEHQIQSKPLNVCIDGETTVIGGGSHVNWKTGVYRDKQGAQKKLTKDQLNKLRYVRLCWPLWSPCCREFVSSSFFVCSARRERNRMHAKLT
jgi:hypothetical protein